MADALDPSTSAWEQIHGIHHVPKTYVPPFMQAEVDQMQAMGDQNEASPQKIKDKMYDYEVEDQDLNPNEESLIQIQPRNQGTRQQSNIDFEQEQHLEDLPEQEAGRR